MTAEDSEAATLDVPDDAYVAAVAAVSTIALTFAFEYGVGADPPFLSRLAPLGPYFLSIFTRGVDLGPVDTVRVWSLLTAAVALSVFLFYAV